MKQNPTPPHLTHATGAPVTDNLNIQTAGPRGPALLQDIWLIEKLAHFDREVIPERRMHARGSGAHGTFTVTHDISRYTKAKIFAAVGKKEIIASYGNSLIADAEFTRRIRVAMTAVLSIEQV
jgi:catalase